MLFPLNSIFLVESVQKQPSIGVLKKGFPDQMISKSITILREKLVSITKMSILILLASV